GLDHILFDEIDVPHAAFNNPHFVARAGVVGVCAVTRFDTVWAMSRRSHASSIGRSGVGSAP
ncbi:hypothetical protein, partial [Caballeronia sordidicola]|uniref:hypothetical protein n=1 Tax=Caballeronia sordidicola TaxID=196367 RepID=UPI000555B838